MHFATIRLKMPTKLDPGSERVEACYRALLKLRRQFAGKGGKEDEYGASVNFVAEQTGLPQQNLSKLWSTRSIGIEFADQIAAYMGTTVDGLVWQLVHGGEGAARVRDLPGWKRARADAEHDVGDVSTFDMAADVVVPGPLRELDKHFALTLARLLQDYSPQRQAVDAPLAAISAVIQPGRVNIPERHAVAVTRRRKRALSEPEQRSQRSDGGRKRRATEDR